MIDGFLQRLKEGIRYRYRNVEIRAYTSSAGGYIDVDLIVRCNKAASNPYGCNGEFKQRTYLQIERDKIRIEDFIGGPKGVGVGRQAINHVVLVLQAAFPDDKQVYGRLHNGSGTEEEHKRRVSFWQSVGFTVDEPDNHNSLMHASVGDLIIKDTYKGNRLDPYGVPYYVPLESFQSMDTPVEHKKDLEELATLPRNELQDILDSMPTEEDVKADDERYFRYSRYLRRGFGLLFATVAGALSNYLESPNYLLVDVAIGYFVGWMIYFNFNILPWKNKSLEDRGKGFLKAKQILKDWLHNNPTGLYFLSDMAIEKELGEVNAYSGKDAEYFEMKHLQEILTIHQKILP